MSNLFKRELATGIVLSVIAGFLFLFQRSIETNQSFPKIFAVVAISIIIIWLMIMFFSGLTRWWLTHMVIVSAAPKKVGAEFLYYSPILSSSYMRKFLQEDLAITREVNAIEDRLSTMEMKRIDRKFKSCLMKELKDNLEKIDYCSIKKFLIFPLASFVIFFISIIMLLQFIYLKFKGFSPELILPALFIIFFIFIIVFREKIFKIIITDHYAIAIILFFLILFNSSLFFYDKSIQSNFITIIFYIAVIFNAILILGIFSKLKYTNILDRVVAFGFTVSLLTINLYTLYTLIPKLGIDVGLQITTILINISFLVAMPFAYLFADDFADSIVPDENMSNRLLYGVHFEWLIYEGIKSSVCVKKFEEYLLNEFAPMSGDSVGDSRLSIAESKRIIRIFKRDLTIQLRENLENITFSLFKKAIFFFLFTTVTLITIFSFTFLVIPNKLVVLL